MFNYHIDSKEPSWEWDETVPSQYYASREDAEKSMRRAMAVDGQRFKHFRIYEQKAPGDWILLEEFSSERAENSN